MFKNFYRENMKVNYLIALIKSYNPKVVITSIDNSQEFYSVSKKLNNKIKFIALQGATGRSKISASKIYKKNFFTRNTIAYQNMTRRYLKEKKWG